MKGLYQPMKVDSKAIQEFMAFYQYPEATAPIKMHLLEDHEVGKYLPSGFGLLGEQGAELIHAQFNRLGLVFAPICCAQLKNIY